MQFFSFALEKPFVQKKKVLYEQESFIIKYALFWC